MPQLHFKVAWVLKPCVTGLCAPVCSWRLNGSPKKHEEHAWLSEILVVHRGPSEAQACQSVFPEKGGKAQNECCTTTQVRQIATICLITRTDACQKVESGASGSPKFRETGILWTSQFGIRLFVYMCVNQTWSSTRSKKTEGDFEFECSSVPCLF